MRIIAWRIGDTNLAWNVLVTVITLMLAHLCCIVPGILVPFGLIGTYAWAQTLPEWWRRALQIGAIALICLRALRLWQTKMLSGVDIVSLIVSVIIISSMLFW